MGVTGLVGILFGLTPHERSYTYYSPYSTYTGSFGGQVLAYFLIFCWGLLLTAVTLFFSARCKRSLSAFGIVLGLLFIGLAVIPGLASGSVPGGMVNPSVYFHPNVIVGTLLQARFDDADTNRMFERAWISCGVYLLFTVIFIVWTEFTMRFADGDVKFIRRNHA